MDSSQDLKRKLPTNFEDDKSEDDGARTRPGNAPGAKVRRNRAIKRSQSDIPQSVENTGNSNTPPCDTFARPGAIERPQVRPSIAITPGGPRTDLNASSEVSQTVDDVNSAKSAHNNTLERHGAVETSPAHSPTMIATREPHLQRNFIAPALKLKAGESGAFARTNAQSSKHLATPASAPPGAATIGPTGSDTNVSQDSQTCYHHSSMKKTAPAATVSRGGGNGIPPRSSSMIPYEHRSAQSTKGSMAPAPGPHGEQHGTMQNFINNPGIHGSQGPNVRVKPEVKRLLQIKNAEIQVKSADLQPVRQEMNYHAPRQAVPGSHGYGGGADLVQAQAAENGQLRQQLALMKHEFNRLVTGQPGHSFFFAKFRESLEQLNSQSAHVQTLNHEKQILSQEKQILSQEKQLLSQQLVAVKNEFDIAVATQPGHSYYFPKFAEATEQLEGQGAYVERLREENRHAMDEKMVADSQATRVREELEEVQRQFANAKADWMQTESDLRSEIKSLKLACKCPLSIPPRLSQAPRLSHYTAAPAPAHHGVGESHRTPVSGNTPIPDKLGAPSDERITAPALGLWHDDGTVAVSSHGFPASYERHNVPGEKHYAMTPPAACTVAENDTAASVSGPVGEGRFDTKQKFHSVKEFLGSGLANHRNAEGHDVPLVPSDYRGADVVHALNGEMGRLIGILHALAGENQWLKHQLALETAKSQTIFEESRLAIEDDETMDAETADCELSDLEAENEQLRQRLNAEKTWSGTVFREKQRATEMKEIAAAEATSAKEQLVIKRSQFEADRKQWARREDDLQGEINSMIAGIEGADVIADFHKKLESKEKLRRAAEGKVKEWKQKVRAETDRHEDAEEVLWQMNKELQAQVKNANAAASKTRKTDAQAIEGLEAEMEILRGEVAGKERKLQRVKDAEVVAMGA